MPNVGPLELAIVLIIALVVLGPKRLPEVGRSLGNGIREFKDSLTMDSHRDDDLDDDEPAALASDSEPEEEPATTAATPSGTATPPPPSEP